MLTHVRTWCSFNSSRVTAWKSYIHVLLQTEIKLLVTQVSLYQQPKMQNCTLKTSKFWNTSVAPAMHSLHCAFSCWWQLFLFYWPSGAIPNQCNEHVCISVDHVGLLRSSFLIGRSFHPEGHVGRIKWRMSHLIPPTCSPAEGPSRNSRFLRDVLRKWIMRAENLRYHCGPMGLWRLKLSFQITSAVIDCIADELLTRPQEVQLIIFI
jgi:hypothetical protein